MRIFLIIAVLFLLLGSVELFAQTYDFEFQVITGGAPFTITVRTQDGIWPHTWDFEFEEWYRMDYTRVWQKDAPLEKVKAIVDCGSESQTQYIRNPCPNQVNKLVFNFWDPEPPGPPVPQGGDE